MTTQPSPGQVMGIWDEALKEYDEIVYIPMSSGLSGSYQTAAMLAEDYEGKVHVVNNQRISVTQRQSVLDALRLLEAGKSAKEIKDILEEDKFNSSIYLMVDTLVYLKKDLTDTGRLHIQISENSALNLAADDRLLNENLSVIVSRFNQCLLQLLCILSLVYALG